MFFISLVYNRATETKYCSINTNPKQFNIVECDCFGHYKGDNCLIPASCDSKHCDGHKNCVMDPSSENPICVGKKASTTISTHVLQWVLVYMQYIHVG